MNLGNVLQKPVISEKSLAQQAEGRYSFLVDPKASKGQIKQAVAVFFGVDPIRVWHKKSPGKNKKTGKKRLLKQYQDKKIATVQLKKGEKIAILEAEKK